MDEAELQAAFENDRLRYSNRMDEAELQAQFEKELIALEQSGAGMPFTFKPSEGWMLLSLLQLALRHPGVSPTQGTGVFADRLARNIEGRLCKTPAMKEVAARGWNPQFDEPKLEATPDPEPERPGDTHGSIPTASDPPHRPAAPPSRIVRKRK